MVYFNNKYNRYKIINMKNYIDSLLQKYIKKEALRQNNEWNLIASENICYEEVRKLCASVLMNKYAEGTYSNRFYQGCRYSNELEFLGINRAKKLFNAEYANLQPHSGSSANLIVYYGI